MEKDWFKRKLVNPRTYEGEPRTEALKYARKFFEEISGEDNRFSGMSIIGSTVKGYGIGGKSDVDIALFYYEPYQNRPGTWRKDDCISKFTKLNNTKKETEGNSFDI